MLLWSKISRGESIVAIGAQRKYINIISSVRGSIPSKTVKIFAEATIEITA